MFVTADFLLIRPTKLRAGSLAVALGFAVTLFPQTALAACESLPQEWQTAICTGGPSAQNWQAIEARIDAIQTARPDLAQALEEDQALFTALLIEAQASTPEAKAAAIEARLRFLTAITVEAPSGFVGTWQNAAARVTITAKEQNVLGVDIASGHFEGQTCELHAEGRAQEAFLLLELPPSDEIALTHAEGLLGLDYTRAGRMAQGPLPCDSAPALSGWYFPLSEKEQ